MLKEIINQNSPESSESPLVQPRATGHDGTAGLKEPRRVKFSTLLRAIILYSLAFLALISSVAVTISYGIMILFGILPDSMPSPYVVALPLLLGVTFWKLTKSARKFLGEVTYSLLCDAPDMREDNSVGAIDNLENSISSCAKLGRWCANLSVFWFLLSFLCAVVVATESFAQLTTIPGPSWAWFSSLFICFTFGVALFVVRKEVIFAKCCFDRSLEQAHEKVRQATEKSRVVDAIHRVEEIVSALPPGVDPDFCQVEKNVRTFLVAGKLPFLKGIGVGSAMLQAIGVFVSQGKLKPAEALELIQAMASDRDRREIWYEILSKWHQNPLVYRIASGEDELNEFVGSLVGKMYDKVNDRGGASEWYMELGKTRPSTASGGATQKATNVEDWAHPIISTLIGVNWRPEKLAEVVWFSFFTGMNLSNEVWSDLVSNYNEMSSQEKGLIISGLNYRNDYFWKFKEAYRFAPTIAFEASLYRFDCQGFNKPDQSGEVFEYEFQKYQLSPLGRELFDLILSKMDDEIVVHAMVLEESSAKRIGVAAGMFLDRCVQEVYLPEVESRCSKEHVKNLLSSRVLKRSLVEEFLVADRRTTEAERARGYRDSLGETLHRFKWKPSTPKEKAFMAVANRRFSDALAEGAYGIEALLTRCEQTDLSVETEPSPLQKLLLSGGDVVSEFLLYLIMNPEYITTTTCREGDVLVFIVDTLGKMQERKSVPYIISCGLTSEVLFHQVELPAVSVRALGNICDFRAVDKLIEIFQSENEQLLFDCAEALEKIMRNCAGEVSEETLRLAKQLQDREFVIYPEPEYDHHGFQMNSEKSSDVVASASSIRQLAEMELRRRQGA